jgi:hypothetical protein
VLLALCILLLVFAYNEKIFKEKPWLLYVFSFAVAIGIEVRTALEKEGNRPSINSMINYSGGK